MVQTAFAFILNLQGPLLIQNHAIADNGKEGLFLILAPPLPHHVHMQVRIKQGTRMTRCTSEVQTALENMSHVAGQHGVSGNPLASGHLKEEGAGRRLE